MIITKKYDIIKIAYHSTNEEVDISARESRLNLDIWVMICPSPVDSIETAR